eukprot:gene10050-2369_t
MEPETGPGIEEPKERENVELQELSLVLVYIDSMVEDFKKHLDKFSPDVGFGAMEYLHTKISNLSMKYAVKERDDKYSYTVGTWNIKGKTFTSEATMKTIFSFIQSNNMDIFCLQEIKLPAKKNGTVTDYKNDEKYIEYLKELEFDYNVITKHLGKGRSIREGGTFLYNTGKCKLLDVYVGFDDPDISLGYDSNVKLFCRKPMIGYFEFLDTKKIICVVSFHIKDGSGLGAPKRDNEIEETFKGIIALQKSSTYQDIEFFLFVGDFNLDCELMKKRLEKFKSENNELPPYQIMHTKVPTLTKDNVDYVIVYKPNGLHVAFEEVTFQENSTKTGGRVVSDHKPALFKFNVSIVK